MGHRGSTYHVSCVDCVPDDPRGISRTPGVGHHGPAERVCAARSMRRRVQKLVTRPVFVDFYDVLLAFGEQRWILHVSSERVVDDIRWNRLCSEHAP